MNLPAGELPPAGPGLGRLALGLVLGSAVALGLLSLMQSLITGPGSELLAEQERPVIDFIRVRQDTALQVRQRERPPPPELEPPPPTPMPLVPPPPAPPKVAQQPLGLRGLDLPMALADAPFLGGMAAPVGETRDVVALARTPPIYPMGAKRRGIEGWVELEFTVSAEGQVRDVRVVAAEPPGVFDQAATSAILRWKFKPRMEAGRAVEARVSQRLSFDLKR